MDSLTQISRTVNANFGDFFEIDVSRPVDWMLWVFLPIFVIETIIIVVIFVVRTVFLWVNTIQFVELVTMAVKYK